MFGTIKGRLLIIVAVLAVSAIYLYRNYSECAKKPAGERALCSPIKLGLDLQGGMHLVLEVSDPEGTLTPETRADATDRALKIIRTRVDEFGVEEPLIQKVGDDRIIVELAGIRDEERAKAVIRQTAFLEFQLVTEGRELREALPRIDRAIVAALGPELERGAEPEAQQPRETVQELLFRQQRDTAAADTGAAAAADTAAPPSRRPLTELLLDAGGAGQYLVSAQDTDVVNRYLALPEVQRLIPRGLDLRWAAEMEGRGAQLYRRLYVLEDRPFMTGEMLEDANASRDPQFNETVVNFELSRRGGRIFDKVTAQHIGDQIAIVLDQEVYSAPVVRSRIGASGRIEMGQASMDEAQDLALVLRAGALPAPLEVIEERTVGPSLGADSIEHGKFAGVLGVLLVLSIMLAYYRLAGVLATLALSVYVGIVLGGLAAFNATLTVPGIAGLVLSIGMAVDANVLIFERIREELAAARAVRTAVDEGFRHAMSAIIDSNLTTLATALILFWVGTGPVRGFAVTLSIGIVASFFSAVYVTRTLFLIYLERRRAVTTLSI
ncbi:MAG: protein translocase subunit SecD [Gemmatimonadetes bacterium]|nr:protein translocase subunit SecD [Gemmatimonadota bacterium]